MRELARTPVGELLSGIMLELFRLNSGLLTSGDRLVEGLGLTSARWQMLGAIRAAQRPQPVAWIARDLGANRQNVQRIVNDLANDGLVRFEANPHHRRAQLVVLTDEGRQAFEAAMRLQAPWINQLSAGVTASEIKTLHRVITKLQSNLDQMAGADEPD
ncbi:MULTISPECIES: MarR family winged helix-turn-helix transcriptional regulator [Paraburkholderia]|uniref:MarR family winged helix-turn-helix transcriptional regulator n=1 Tax=Paraburkholderia TaxID=1822464 RepID=UPI000841D276|nr:MarR family winged helix-turn-helix transcriptional regulator [Paraburkholderia nodosa]